MQFMNMKFDPISATEKISILLNSKLPFPGGDVIRRRMLDVLLNFGIPFNRWLGMRIKEFSPDKVAIESPPTVLRRNHVGTAHACSLALIGEYAAGLVVAQNFPIAEYRMIIGKLEIDYHKAGRGRLLGSALAPDAWPELENDEGWVDMKTDITDESGRVISECRTRWQIKSWKKIEADRASRSR